MSFKEKATDFAVRQAIKYARKDFDRNAPKILSIVEKADVKRVNRSTYAGLHKVMDDPTNNWMRFAKDLICNTDEHVIGKLIPPLMNIAINSYSKRMESIEKYGCNVPWAILMDPTAACNLKCKGCWAAEYGYKQNTVTQAAFRTTILQELSSKQRHSVHICTFTPAVSRQ